MHWIVGIDEAGYGPNLGPLVQSATAIAVDEPTECLWQKYAIAIRRASDPDDGRIAIDDSKLIHVGPKKYDRLKSSLSLLRCLEQQIQQIALGESIDRLEREFWYRPISKLDENDESFNGDRPAPIDVPWIRVVITATPQFNEIISTHGSKGASLSLGAIRLMQAAADGLPDPQSIIFVIDKQGGRNSYAPMISTAFPGGWVRALRETAQCSEYEVIGYRRTIRLTFQPKAEQACLPVALASMMAKFTRERLMRQFNQFWIEQIPGLEPTAGYAVDARRFYKCIRPAMKKLGIAPELVWRMR